MKLFNTSTPFKLFVKNCLEKYLHYKQIILIIKKSQWICHYIHIYIIDIRERAERVRESVRGRANTSRFASFSIPKLIIIIIIYYAYIYILNSS